MHNSYMQDEAELKLTQYQARDWCQAHGRQLPPPPLTENIERTIKEWFDLVDDDGTGMLSHEELAAAMSVRALRNITQACSGADA